MGVRNNLVGQKFGRVTVIMKAPGTTHSMYHCRCDCGNAFIVRGSSLTSGNTKSCGCANLDSLKALWEKNRKPNKYISCGGDTAVFTQKGEIFWLDTEDWEALGGGHCWRLHVGYPATNINNKIVFLHTLIMPHGDGLEVDEIDGDECNCKRNNLRVVTHQQNCMNRGVRSDSKTGVSGVRKEKDKKKYRVVITREGDVKHIGYFEDFDDAVKAREEAEDEYFGEYARRNA